MSELIRSVQVESAVPTPGKVEALTEQERKDIEHEISHYPHKQAATIEALKVVQKYQGWVSDGKVKAIAEILDVSAEEVDGVATFYNKIYRKPVGKKVLAVCDSVSCWIMGYDNIMQHICEKLAIQPGQTTEDGCFTLLPTPCLGACDKGPVMMNGEELVESLTKEKVDALIGEGRVGEGRVGEGRVGEGRVAAGSVSVEAGKAEAGSVAAGRIAGGSE